MTLDALKAKYAGMTPGKLKRCRASDGNCRCGLIWGQPADVVLFHEIAATDDEDGVTQEQACKNGIGIVALHNAFPILVERYERALELLKPLADAVTAEPMACVAVNPSHCRNIAAFLATAAKPLTEDA